MDRPYIICHMVTSLDGKVTGDFLSSPICQTACELYYQYNREIKSDGFICGRVTMEGSFTGGWYPDLDKYPAVSAQTDFLPDSMATRFAVAFDPHGRLGWKESRIQDPDGDPGYDGAQIIEILTELADPRYLGYLQAIGIPYLFAGKTEIDVELALYKLKAALGIQTLLLEGGSILNGAFQRVGMIDEISLVVAPVIGQSQDKPLFTDSQMENYTLVKLENYEDNIWLNYRRNAT